ncbi:MAG: hypothetical protein NXI22_26950, partial [bacterium]|nr:hypothetical protein [bacterium]
MNDGFFIDFVFCFSRWFFRMHAAKDAIAAFIERVGSWAVRLQLLVITGAEIFAIRSIPLFALFDAIFFMQL